jgi:hypothetical protein
MNQWRHGRMSQWRQAWIELTAAIDNGDGARDNAPPMGAAFEPTGLYALNRDG